MLGQCSTNWASSALNDTFPFFLLFSVLKQNKTSFPFKGGNGSQACYPGTLSLGLRSIIKAVALSPSCILSKDSSVLWIENENNHSNLNFL